MVSLLRSATKTLPVSSAATPHGLRNRALAPMSSWLPGWPASPAKVLTTPLGVIFRMVLFWPDRLVIRIRERKPVAFVSLRSGSLLIDAQGVLLEQPAQGQFSFPVLSGVREEDSEVERRGHVRAFLQVQEEMGYLAKEISEVDASDPDNIRMVAQVDRRVVTLLLGDGNYAQRFQNFLNHYPEIRKGSPQAKVFDLRLDGRITVKE